MFKGMFYDDSCLKAGKDGLIDDRKSGDERRLAVSLNFGSMY